ncbi:MAG: methyltransferase [Candidatus Woesearchaeota archaeon]|nr:methyltransferase [Candidatus Woesearchaeota archaeon]
MIVLSHYQAAELLNALNKELSEIDVSLDLGITESKVKIDKNSFILIKNDETEKITIDDVKKIIKDNKVCFLIKENKIIKIQFFSEKTNRFYKLFPTGIDIPPTVEISGIRMHVTKEYDPYKDAIKKIENIMPTKGKVLDTCTGLGYTAIMAAKNGADLVVSCEKDKNILEIQKYNPWSSELFSLKNIKIINNDMMKQIKKFSEQEFDRIVHDPPSLKIAGELYSLEFYKELYRVLKNRGIIYHYTGSPGEKKGIDVVSGVMKRMKEAGFRELKRVHYGVAGKK